VLFVTFSGKTAELVSVATHLPLDVIVMALTAHTDLETCPLLCTRPGSILLPAPIHESETNSFGVSAPTTSTTVAMAIGDMLALTAADMLHQGKSSSVFLRNHPGGSIGAAKAALKS
jgi:D-arabinose 5-phosphate isomerase GutQ